MRDHMEEKLHCILLSVLGSGGFTAQYDEIHILKSLRE